MVKIFGSMLLSACGGSSDAPSSGASDTSTVAPAEKVTLKMASAFPSSLDILGDGAIEWTDTVKALSGGSLEVKFF